MTTKDSPISRPSTKALAAAGITVFFWASAFVSIRSAGQHYSPGALALGRMATAAVILVAILLIRRESIPPRATWPAIAFSGVFWFGLYMVALNWGEQMVDAGTAALLVNIGPILMALLGGWLLREGFSRRLFLGLAVAFTGAAIVGLSTSNGGQASLLGVALCLLAAVCYAAGVVAQKPVLRSATPLQATTFGAAIGAAACLPFTTQLIDDTATAPWAATANVIYLGVFPTAIAFTTWAYALSHTTAGKMGATTYAVPAIVVVLSWLLLGEVPTLAALAGGSLCLVGVAITRGGSRPRRRAAAAEVTSSASPAGRA